MSTRAMSFEYTVYQVASGEWRRGVKDDEGTSR